MQSLTGSAIRAKFLEFFEAKGHRPVHSSSLVPQNDPTLLFTNAGMNQFKDVFLGAEQRDYTRAASSQKCVRAGGKHNDLENVGFTRRHHTFFEMLGNFSFGDYFKREAIAYAWELLTSPEWFAIDPAKLYVTIFEGQGEGDSKVPRDDEAEALWIAAGVPKERIFGMPAKDNFWQMGETGPCGPCSEIYYDLGLIAAEHREADGTPQDVPFPGDDQRYMEIWNLVFMQFDRALDPTTGEGILTLLPKPSIDTGMGLERVACVLQGVLSNYQTDLFTPLIAKAAELTGIDTPVAEAAVSDAKPAASLRIIAEHARAATFLISDGVVPSNEGRGYVLRKILRRGIRHGRLLGQEQPFMHQMVSAVRAEMAAAYPELNDTADRVSKVILVEEEQFARVLGRGLVELHLLIAAVIKSSKLRMASLFREIGAEYSTKDIVYTVIRLTSGAYVEYEVDVAATKKQLTKRYGKPNEEFEQRLELIDRKPVVSGTDAFRLYETFGMPLDFMVDAARDAGIAFDMEGFEAAKQEEQARARASWKGGSQKSASPAFRELAKTDFAGYTNLRVDGTRILALVKDGIGVPALHPGESGEAVLEATSFYADSGGQVGDIGWLYSDSDGRSAHNTLVAEVTGATRPVQGVFAHKVTARQTLAVGDTVDAVVDEHNRRATERNHTATHLLHAALREVLGTHVKQAGSLNDSTRLRFDFSHFAQVGEAELAEVESIVNRQVLSDAKVETLVDVPIEVAVNELGAMALFGEKYGDKVRVVQIGAGLGDGSQRGFSVELCGGTHTRATGEIGLIKLTGEGSVSSGIRRVEAISGTNALAEFRRGFELARVVSQLTGGADSEASPADALRLRLATQEEEMKRLRRELDQAKMKAASASVADAAANAVEVKGIKLLAQRVDGVEKAQLRELVDTLRGRLGSGVVVLGAAAVGPAGEGRVTLIVGVTKDLTGRIQAGKLVGLLAAKVGGKGGGRPDLAEAGGTDVSALDSTLTAAAEVLSALLS